MPVGVLLALFLLLGVGAWGVDRTGGSLETEQLPKAVLTEAQEKDYRAHLEAGRLLLDKNHLESAVVELQEAIAIKPDSVEAHDFLGQALIRAGNWAATITTYQKLMRLAPRETRFHKLLIQVTSAYNMPKQEADAIERLLQVEPSGPEEKTLLARLGKLYLEELGKPEKMVAAYERLAKLSPEDPSVWRKLEEGYLAVKNPKGRLIALERVAELLPDDLEAQLTLARAYEEQQRPDLEIALYQKLLARHKGDPDLVRGLALAYGHLAEIHAEKTHYALADRTYQQALALAPDHPLLLQKRKELGRELRPRVEVQRENGTSGGNEFLRHRGTVAVPLTGSETLLEVEEVLREVGDAFRNASVQQTRVAVTHYLGEKWYVNGMGGASNQGGLYRLRFERRDPRLPIRITHFRDYVFDTPHGMRANIGFTATQLEAEYVPVNRVKLQGEFLNGRYSDSNWEQLFVWGGEVAVFQEKPLGHTFSFVYLRNQLRHRFEARGDPILFEAVGSPYFSPVKFRTWNLGARWQWEGSRLFASAEYFRNGDERRNAGKSYAFSLEYQATRALGAFASYQAGGSSGGRIAAAGFNQTSDRKLEMGVRLRW